VGDKSFGRFLSLVHVASFFLGRVSLSICPDWNELWRHSRFARFARTRWESQPEGLFYTPSRWLVLIVTLAIAARFAYGWWRAMHSGSGASAGQHWLITASGTQLSLAVAAGLIGYYLVYSIGVRLRLTRHERRRSN
jgi:hypothetical protein